jgi:hypothetical protein
MITRWGLSTRVPAARPIRRSQGRRDPRASPRGRHAAPTQPTPDTELGRPRRAQRTDQTAPCEPASATARVTQNPAALARPPGRPPLDLPAPAARPPTHLAARPGPGAADGPGEPRLGLPPHPRRAHRTRPPYRRLHRVEDPQSRWHRPRTAAIRTDLATVPHPRRPTPSSRSTSPTSTPYSRAASTSR